MSNQIRNCTMNNVARGNFRLSLWTRVRTTVTRWHNRRIAVRQLRLMPDALLRDIGIERHQINDAVRNFGVQPTPLKASAPISAPPTASIQRAA